MRGSFTLHWLVATSVLACARAEHEPPPTTPEPVTVAPAASTSVEPNEPSEPAPSRQASAPSADAGVAKGGDCDEYLRVYERCEPKLQAQIQSGNLLSARSERARIDHLRAQVVNPADLEAVCREFQAEIEKRCR